MTAIWRETLSPKPKVVRRPAPMVNTKVKHTKAAASKTSDVSNCNQRMGNTVITFRKITKTMTEVAAVIQNEFVAYWRLTNQPPDIRSRPPMSGWHRNHDTSGIGFATRMSTVLTPRTTSWKCGKIIISSFLAGHTCILRITRQDVGCSMPQQPEQKP